MAPAPTEFRHQRCRDAGENDDRNDRQRRAPSSTNSPANSRSTLLASVIMTTLRLRPARQHEAAPLTAQKHHCKSDDGQIRTGKLLRTFTGQKAPNRDSMTPTANLSVFSGTAPAADARQGDGGDHRQAASARHSGKQRAASGTQRNHDEHYLEAFEKHRLELVTAASQSSRASWRRACSRNSASGCERRRFIVQRNDAGRAQDRFSQPAHANSRSRTRSRAAAGAAEPDRARVRAHDDECRTEGR